MSDILVIGDDAVGVSIIQYLNRTETVIFIGRGDQLSNRVEEHTQKVIEAREIPEFIGGIDMTPDSAVVATSQDSQNLLVVQHLRLGLDIKGLIVRLNVPQNIEAYADLPVTLIDVTDLVGSAFAQQLEQSTSSP